MSIIQEQNLLALLVERTPAGGATVNQVAEEFGVTTARVRQIMQETEKHNPGLIARERNGRSIRFAIAPLDEELSEAA